MSNLTSGLMYLTYRADSALGFGPDSINNEAFRLYAYSSYINQGTLSPCNALSTQSPPRPFTSSLPFADPSLIRIGQTTLTLATGSGSFPLTNQVYFQFVHTNTSLPVIGLGIRLNDYTQSTIIKLALYSAIGILTSSQIMTLLAETISFTVPPQPGPSLTVELLLPSSMNLTSGLYAIGVSGSSKS